MLVDSLNKEVVITFLYCNASGHLLFKFLFRSLILSQIKSLEPHYVVAVKSQANTLRRRGYVSVLTGGRDTSALKHMQKCSHNEGNLSREENLPWFYSTWGK